MKNKHRKNIHDVLELFENSLSAADVLSSKAQAQICDAIIKERLKRNMTQKEFAAFLHVSQGMVSRWESSDYNFSINKLAEIAALLDLDLDIRMEKPKISISFTNNISSPHSSTDSIQIGPETFTNQWNYNFVFHTDFINGRGEEKCLPTN